MAGICRYDSNIPLNQVRGNTADILEHLEFGFYDHVWFKDNAGTFTFEPGPWLGVCHIVGGLVCYHVLTQRGNVIYIYSP